MMISKQAIPFYIVIIFIIFLSGCSQASDPKILFEQGKYEAAYKLWQPLAEQGDLYAQNYIGIHHYLGLGVSRDYKKAKQWFEKAAEAGFADAQYNIGMMYENGEYVEQSYIEAHKWFTAAIENGKKKKKKRIEEVKAYKWIYGDRK